MLRHAEDDVLRYPKGATVRHRSGEIKGVVLNVFGQEERPAGYFVRWDDGSHSYHSENELIWVNIDQPDRDNNQPPAK